jgi:hypothetical protein
MIVPVSWVEPSLRPPELLVAVLSAEGFISFALSLHATIKHAMIAVNNNRFIKHGLIHLLTIVAWYYQVCSF